MVEGPQRRTVDVRAGFAAFYEAEFPTLVAVATALCGNFHDAEDVVQDTMVKALLRWHRLQHFDRPGAWCNRVLINACRNLFRHRQTRSRHLARQRREEPMTAGASTDAMVFWEAVRQLPTRPRQVVVLHYAGDLTVSEIAGTLGIPEGTVQSDLFRSRKALAHVFVTP